MDRNFKATLAAAAAVILGVAYYQLLNLLGHFLGAEFVTWLFAGLLLLILWYAFRSIF